MGLLKKVLKQPGFTLLEIMVSMLVMLIIILGITSFYGIEYNFRKTIQDDTAIAREARIAMDHMVSTLRWAKDGTVTVAANKVTATIAGGHLPYITADTKVTYEQKNKSEYLEYTMGAVGAIKIARYVSSFSPELAANSRDLKLRLTMQKGNSQFYLRTFVHIIGDY